MFFRKNILLVVMIICSLSVSVRAEEYEDTSHSTGSESSTPSITGFFAGVDAGGTYLKDVFTAKKKKSSDKKEDDTEKKETSSDIGFIGDIFCGYNVQIGRFIFGAEGLIAMETTKAVTDIPTIDTNIKEYEKVSQQRKYSFWLTPKIGFRITRGMSGFVNFGTVVGKHMLEKFNFADEKAEKKEKEEKSKEKSEIKSSLLVGFAVEYNFGTFFLRGGVDKIFKRNIEETAAGKLDSESYAFKIGGGCRF